jgi:hypothetical protein
MAADIADERKRSRLGRRSAYGSASGKAEAAADLLLAVAVAGSMLAIGTVYPSALVIVAAVVGSAVVIAVAGPASTVPPRFNAPAAIAVSLAIYTLLQAIPLPIKLLTTLAPTNADVWRRALLPFGSPGPDWTTVSLDPGSSYVEVLKWLVYAGIFVLAAWMSARRGAEWGIGLVFASSVLLALVTIGHGLASATTIFGIYKPIMGVAPWHMSPLLNPNNLAGYLNLGTMCGLGLLVARRLPVPRWTVGLGVATIVGINLISASRAGFVVLPLGVLLFAWVHRASEKQRGEKAPRRMFPWMLAAAVGGGAVLAFLGGTTATWHELYDRNLEKLAILTWTKPLIRDHLWFGIGRGAFETVFPAYRSSPGNIVFTHAENFPAQWLSEWGVPVGLGAMGMFSWTFRPATMGIRRSSTNAGGWIGVFIVLVQNLMDLALELPAVSIAVAATLGSIWGDYKRRRVSRATAVEIHWRSSTWMKRSLMMGTVLVFCVALVATSSAGVRDAGRDKEDLYEALTRLDAKDRRAVATFRDDLRRAMLRHPAEPYLSFLGAIAATAAKDSNPVPWIQRSLERGNVNGRAHLLLADILAAKGATGQALMELRFAVNDDPGLAGHIARRAVSWTRDFDELLRCVSAGRDGAFVLESLAAQLNNSDDAVLRERFEREALARDSSRPEPHRAIAHRLLQRIESHAADACGGETLIACEAELQQHIAALEKAFPNRSDADDLRAKLLLARGQAEEGERLLARRCNKVEDHALCLQSRLQLASQVPGSRVLAAAAKDALGASCESSAECANLATSIGDLMINRGDWGGAFDYYMRAVRDQPTEARWLKLAQIASELGWHARAADALQKVAQLRGHADQNLNAEIQVHRAKALRLEDK